MAVWSLLECQLMRQQYREDGELDLSGGTASVSSAQRKKYQPAAASSQARSPVSLAMDSVIVSPGKARLPVKHS